MKMVRGMFVALVCMLALCGKAQADTLPTLTLDPTDGSIVGAPGSTVGWGFTLTNNGSNFAVVTSSDFCVGVITSPCGNSLGTYTDLIAAQFFVVGPSPESSNFTQAFDNSAQTGVGSFLINLGATGSAIGQIVLTYDLFSVGPNSANFNPELDTVSAGNYLTAPASVTVGTVRTPEPGSFLLLLSGLAIGSLVIKLRR
jgi:hypothetical protein